jgi:spore coat polysaccharide biosynthesis predicted glycosyltransferase SpsG
LGGINNLDELLWQADLALISGGHLKCEAAITQTPAIMIATQWHQIPLAEEFSKLTKMTNLGYMSFIEVETLVKSITKFETASARQKAAQKAKTVMRDGNGATRVFSAISALIAGGD